MSVAGDLEETKHPNPEDIQEQKRKPVGENSIAPSLLQFAKASRIAYQVSCEDEALANEKIAMELPGFTVLHCQEEIDRQKFASVGFKGISLINRTTHEVIIAYRGTDPKDFRNLLVDAGILLGVAGSKSLQKIEEELHNLYMHFPHPEIKGLKRKLAPYSSTVALLTYKPPTNGQRLAAEVARSWFEPMILEGLGVERYHPDFRIEYYAPQMVDLALEFYRVTMDKLYMVQNPTYNPSFLNILGQAIGLKGGPTLKGQGDYKDKVFITGHSLGGFLAQLVAASYEIPASTFNAPGAAEYAEAHKIEFKGTANIKNYIRPNDVVGSFSKHLGMTISIGNFYELAQEKRKLKPIFDNKQEECRRNREAFLENALEQYRRDIEEYPKTRAYLEYLKKLEQYKVELAKYNEAYKDSLTVTKFFSYYLVCPSEPKAPPAPTKPTQRDAIYAHPNPYLTEDGQIDYQKIAQDLYASKELKEYVLKNHGLPLFIEQFSEPDYQIRD